LKEVVPHPLAVGVPKMALFHHLFISHQVSTLKNGFVPSPFYFSPISLHPSGNQSINRAIIKINIDLVGKMI